MNDLDKYQIQCPKCGHKQNGGLECRACGIIFRKVEQRQERQQAKIQVLEAEKATPSLLSRLVSVMMLVAMSVGLTYYFTRPREQQPAPLVQAQQATTIEQQATPPTQERPSQQASQATPLPQAAAPGALRGAIIEEARNATVSVITPWGQGSGFFVLDTYIVTNKHVVKADEQQVAQLRQQVDAARQMISLEEKKMQWLRDQLNQAANEATRQQIMMVLREREQGLAKVNEQLRQAEEQLQKFDTPLSTNDIKIIFADGREQKIHSFRVSPKRDLAMLTVSTAHSSVLKAAPANVGLHQGDRVYTIGNPMGLQNTVTSGVFSGYRQLKETGDIFLQTDAPINPGNSGGPLIDEQGRVHGVNTMNVRDTQGIGFAIPIKAVFDEFGLFQP